VTEVDEAADRLYGAALEDFTSERTRLAKELRDAGNRADADAVAKLRKPSVAAWALNQLARRNRRDVDLLLDAGHRLREAQVGVLSGAEKEAFERARQSERDALRRLTREAEQLLRERGGASATVLNQIGESLRAAAISPTGRELLARGRFVQPAHAEGFDVVTELAGLATPPKRRAPPAAKKKEEDRAAREAVREAREQLREAERRLRDAEREAEQAARRAEQERAGVEAAEQALDEAQKRLR
jgi:hypothetical protein